MMNKIGVGTIGAMLEGLVHRLEKTSDTPALDARVLFGFVMDQPDSWVMAHPEATLTDGQIIALEAMVSRLENGVPLPYVMGYWNFFGLRFDITPNVLIPRPETELLVERAIAWLRIHPDQRRAIDVGTGSGCIGIALALNIADVQVLATDISAQALEVARHNAMQHGVIRRMEFQHCDLLPPEAGFDLIVANLPYIPTTTLHSLPIYGREPKVALNGGAKGLDLIQRLLTVAPDQLFPGGLLLMEIEASQGPSALSLAYDSFSEAEIHLHKDLSGRDRILEVQV